MLLEDKIENRVGLVLPSEKHKNYRQFIGDLRESGVVFKPSRRTRAASVNVAVLANSVPKLRLCKGDHPGVVLLIDQVLGEIVQSGSGVGIDGQSSPPFGFSISGLLQSIEGCTESEMRPEVAWI
jgi:hypothetical protein